MSSIRWSHGAAALALIAAACGGDGIRDVGDPGPPEPGATRFVSADEGAASGGGPRNDGALADAPGVDEGAGGEGGDERTVEEGDVYRMLDARRLLNLNAWRGLQVIDLGDLEAPRIEGRLPISGTPVELYVSGRHAVVLMNDWRGYWGSRDDVAVDTWQGGVVVVVDLANPAAPVEVDRETVPGWIHRSRMVRGGGQEALYVVSQEWSEQGIVTRAKSFSLAGGRLAPVDEIDLGGWIADIAATPRALLVARNDWQSGDGRSLVSVIDISDPAGTMIEGAEIRTEGRVESQFNMDLRGGVLRVVSANAWGSAGNVNHLETFDATDLQNLRRIDHETFGANEDLYATLFLDDAGFFVTYFRTDPFHAFRIDDRGDATEMSEFVVSGWNDFFRATFGGTRLVGIGTNDQGGWTMAVSLYDITDLENPNPLIARREVQAQSSWSEASWDHRAFTVLEDAVAAPASGGVVETGLILLPFTGWDPQTQKYSAAVQIFTFSADTLTRRGVMVHGSPVHRSFQPIPATAANLSQEELSLFDLDDPDAPAELSRIDLAPNYTAVLPVGDHLLRLIEPGWSWGGGAERPAVVEVIPRGADPDAATPVARFEVPRGAKLYDIGHRRIAAVHFEPKDVSTWPYVWTTTVQIYDLADPTRPAPRGALVTDRIQPASSWGWYFDGLVDCAFADCGGGWYGPRATARVVGDALAFVEWEPRTRSLGQERVCISQPRDPGTCYDGGVGWTDGCTLIVGARSCIERNGGAVCSGEFQRCVWEAKSSAWACAPIDESDIEVRTECHDREVVRHWNRATVEVVDLRDPDAPALGGTIELPELDEAVGSLVAGDTLWLSYKRPVTIPGDARPWVRYFARAIDLSHPARPLLGEGVNVPGELLQVSGNTLYTRDFRWAGDRIESAVARLRLVGDLAILEAHRRFPDRRVDSIALDDAGPILISHRGVGGTTSAMQQLTVLDGSATDLVELATVDVDAWARLVDARAGRAIFEVPGGLLVFNLDRPARPWPQAYFAAQGWPEDVILDGRRIVFAAGRYGIYAFDVDESNLPSQR